MNPDPQPAQPVHPAPPRRRPVGLLIAVGVIAVLAVALAVTLVALLRKDDKPAAAQASSPSAAATFIASGTLELFGTFGPTSDGSCAGVRGYNDIAEGATVTITDSGGKVIALGSLGPGSGSYGVCTFRWRVEGVPRGSGFYGVEVSHRGKVQSREADLAVGKAHLTLGN